MMKKNSNKLSISIEMEVDFFDVDSYQVVWHGNYPKYLERARCKLLEKIGHTYKDMETSGYFFPIVDLHIKYINPLVFMQTFVIRAELKEWKNKLVIDYIIVGMGSGSDSGTDSKSVQTITKAQTTQYAVLMPDLITQFESPVELVASVERALEQSNSQEEGSE